MGEKVFDEFASDYDLWEEVDPDFMPLQHAVGQAVLGRLAPRLSQLSTQEEYRVFEFGVGTGITTEEVLKTDKRIVVTGCDPLPRMILLANQRLEEGFGERTRLLVMNTSAYFKHFPHTFYPLIYSACTVHNMEPEDREVLYKQAAERLSPGGWFIIGDKMVGNEEEFDRGIEERMHALEYFRQRSVAARDQGRIDESKRFEELYHEWMAHEMQDEARRLDEHALIETLSRLSFIRVETVFRQGLYAVVAAQRRPIKV